MQVFKGLYENAANSFLVGAHLAILAAIRDVCKLVVKELTSWVCYMLLYLLCTDAYSLLELAVFLALL